MHLSMLSRWGRRPGIGGGFDSSHRPVVGTFDRFNGLSSNILLTFSCYFDNPHMPCGGAFEQKLLALFKCPAYAPPTPSSLTLIGALCTADMALVQNFASRCALGGGNPRSEVDMEVGNLTQ